MKPLTIPSKKGGALTIDLHCHVLTPAVEKLVADQPGKKAEVETVKGQQGPVSSEYNAKVLNPAIAAQLTDETVRLKDMDAMGVDLQVLSIAPGQFYYWADPDLAREIVRLQNENIAGHCARHPDRFAGLANIAMQHPDIAIEQLEYAVNTLGFRGVEICTSINNKELTDPFFAKFWAKVEELDCLVFLHPQSCPQLADRLNRYYLSNIIGNPLDTTIALSHLIFGGMFDKHPKLKILASHGGGFLPSYCARSDHSYHARTDSHSMAKPPSEYLKQILFDTIVFTPPALLNLLDQVGPSQVVVGTDYPYDMGHYDPHALINAVPGLSAADRRAIQSGNAMRVLGLTVKA